MIYGLALRTASETETETEMANLSFARPLIFGAELCNSTWGEILIHYQNIVVEQNTINIQTFACNRTIIKKKKNKPLKVQKSNK